jgi:hypothetical protein
MDMPDPEFDRLALRYGQLGTLGWSRGEPVRLRMYAPQPLMAKAREHVQWAPLNVKPPGVRRPSPAR